MITVENATIARRGRTIINSLSLTVQAGECVALVGPNGSGKSTLVSALSGDLPIVSGRLAHTGADVAETSPGQMARLRSVMTQQTHVAFGFTVREVVAMGRVPWRGLPQASSDTAEIDSAMAQADIQHLAARPVQALSGGELARVALARTLAQATPVLILDEPIASLDLRHQVDVLALVQQRARQAGAAVLVVLHDLTLAAAFSDRIGLLSQGALVALGAPEEVLTAEAVANVYGIEVVTLPHPESGLPIVVPLAPARTPRTT